MAETPSNPVLEYEPAKARYRPRVSRIVLVIFLPWVVQAGLTFAAYSALLSGTPGEGILNLIGIFFGLGFTIFIIFRSGAPLSLKITLLVLGLPVQFFCLFTIMGNVAMACGTGDAM